MAPSPKTRIVYSVFGYSVPSNDLPVFLPPHKSVPDTSCVNAAPFVDEMERAREHWEIDFGNWQVQAMPLPAHANADEMTPTVVALVCAD